MSCQAVRLLAERLSLALEVYRARCKHADILLLEESNGILVSTGDAIDATTLADTEFALDVDLAFQAFQSEES